MILAHPLSLLRYFPVIPENTRDGLSLGSMTRNSLGWDKNSFVKF